MQEYDKYFRGVVKVEELYAKMQEYLGMDTEIPLQEFEEYYRKVLHHLTGNFTEMSQDEKIKGKYIVALVESNSAARAKRKGPEMKKYRKMQEKMAFWNGAISYNLKKEGLSEQEIDEAIQKLNPVNE